MTTSFQKIVRSLPFLQFTVNFEQSGSRITEAQSVKLIFSLIVTFYLTKIENGTKKFLTQLSHYCFEQRYYFCQKTLFLQKNADISKIKRALVLKIYLLKHMCVYLRAKSEVSSIILTSFRQGEGVSKTNPKKPTRIRVKIGHLSQFTYQYYYL